MRAMGRGVRDLSAIRWMRPRGWAEIQRFTLRGVAPTVLPAARSATPEWGRATTQKLWPKAIAQLA